MYEVYEALLRGENFEANARNWMDANLPNPFESNTEAHKLYFKAHQYCLRWRRGGIDCRSGKKYMFETIHKLMDLNMPNPYIKGKEVETKVELTEEPLPEIEKQTVEITSDELKEDINYLMANMVNAAQDDDVMRRNEEAYLDVPDVPETEVAGDSQFIIELDLDADITMQINNQGKDMKTQMTVDLEQELMKMREYLNPKYIDEGFEDDIDATDIRAYSNDILMPM